MTSRTISKTVAFCAAALVAGAAFSAQGQPRELKLDVQTVVDGVPVACTGIGQTKLDPKWKAYPVRVEFSDALNEYLSDGAVTVTDSKGHAVVSVGCEGPWILLKLAPGAYHIEGRLLHQKSAQPRSASFKAPASGQMRLVLQFPDAKGE